MPGFDTLTVAAITAALLARLHQTGLSGSGSGGGGPVIPSIAMQQNSTTGEYELIDGNTDPPDAYFVDAGGGVIQLQAGATSGLAIEFQDPDYVLVAP